MTTCNQTVHYDVYGTKEDVVDLDLECSLPEGHLEPWHSDGDFYWNKTGENVAELRDTVEKYVDARIQAEVIRLAKKGLV